MDKLEISNEPPIKLYPKADERRKNETYITITSNDKESLPVTRWGHSTHPNTSFASSFCLQQDISLRRKWATLHGKLSDDLCLIDIHTYHQSSKVEQITMTTKGTIDDRSNL